MASIGTCAAVSSAGDGSHGAGSGAPRGGLDLLAELCSKSDIFITTDTLHASLQKWSHNKTEVIRTHQVPVMKEENILVEDTTYADVHRNAINEGGSEGDIACAAGGGTGDGDGVILPLAHVQARHEGPQAARAGSPDAPVQIFPPPPPTLAVSLGALAALLSPNAGNSALPSVAGRVSAAEMRHEQPPQETKAQRGCPVTCTRTLEDKRAQVAARMRKKRERQRQGLTAEQLQELKDKETYARRMRRYAAKGGGASLAKMGNGGGCAAGTGSVEGGGNGTGFGIAAGGTDLGIAADAHRADAGTCSCGGGGFGESSESASGSGGSGSREH